MNAINYAIQQVMFNIPPEILKHAFVSRDVDHLGHMMSIQHVIREKVIDQRVLVDCNMVGGTQAVIQLNQCINNQIDRYNVVINVPKEVTGGRTITAGLHLGQTYNSGGTSFSGGGGTALLSEVNSMQNSMTSFAMPSEANLSIIGENVLLAKNMTNIPSDGFIRVMLSNDPNLSNIGPRSIPDFGKLVVLAVKAYIYNTLSIHLDVGYQVGGVNLGSFKEHIDNYADANELYMEELRERWQKISVFNDPESKARHLKMITRPH